MSEVKHGRFTAKTDESFAVFLIGMRINKLWAVHKWLPVFWAMVPMLFTLKKHPEKGYRNGRLLFGWRSVMMVQYWRSFADLEQFAHSGEDPHRDAWRSYNREAAEGGAVGIWHETYLIEPEQFECVYNNMPRIGLGEALSHVPATGERRTARRRLATPS